MSRRPGGWSRRSKRLGHRDAEGRKGFGKLQDPASGQRRGNRQAGSFLRYSIIRSESKQIWEIHHSIQAPILFREECDGARSRHSSPDLSAKQVSRFARSLRSKDRPVFSRTRPAIGGEFERVCCVLRPPRTAMSYWHADHNIGRSGYGGDFGRGSPRDCSSAP